MVAADAAASGFDSFSLMCCMAASLCVEKSRFICPLFSANTNAIAIAEAKPGSSSPAS